MIEENEDIIEEISEDELEAPVEGDETAESGKYDQIIKGVEKAGGIKQILHGGLSERVVTLASCPVTVVRDV